MLILVLEAIQWVDGASRALRDPWCPLAETAALYVDLIGLDQLQPHDRHATLITLMLENGIILEQTSTQLATSTYGSPSITTPVS